MKKLSAIIIGAGIRGEIYATEMKKLNKQYEVVAVGEISDSRRNKIKEMFNLLMIDVIVHGMKFLHNLKWRILQ